MDNLWRVRGLGLTCGIGSEQPACGGRVESPDVVRDEGRVHDDAAEGADEICGQRRGVVEVEEAEVRLRISLGMKRGGCLVIYIYIYKHTHTYI